MCIGSEGQPVWSDPVADMIERAIYDRKVSEHNALQLAVWLQIGQIAMLCVHHQMYVSIRTWTVEQRKEEAWSD